MWLAGKHWWRSPRTGHLMGWHKGKEFNIKRKPKLNTEDKSKPEWELIVNDKSIGIYPERIKAARAAWDYI